MSSKKRIFSTNTNVNYKDVYLLKNGIEILKTVKREDGDAHIGQFDSYGQKQMLNHAYYPFLDNNVYIVGNVQNLCQSSDSYVDNRQNKGATLLKGDIIEKKQVVNRSSNLYLCKWNNECLIKPQNPFLECDCSNNPPPPSDNCNCANFCSKCKNAKPLFI